MKSYLLLITCILCSALAQAQGYEFNTDAKAKEEVSKIAWLTGEWEGSGWRMGMDRQKHTFRQHEMVQFKLDSTAILIEGKGHKDGEVIHDALAMMTYDDENDRYDFRTRLADGKGGNFYAELKGDTLYWYPGDTMRYIIYLDEQGRWYETGEVNHSGQWYQILEMTLVRKED
ncbi:MAG: hypothetical protein WBB45_20175 [Cyclobacteriaceae bacterium]